MDNLWGIPDVAAYLKLSPATVYLYAQQGKLPIFKVGKHWRTTKQDIDQWIRQRMQKGTSP